MVIDQRIADVGEGQPAKSGNGIVSAERAGLNIGQQLTDIGLVHGMHAATMRRQSD